MGTVGYCDVTIASDPLMYRCDDLLSNCVRVVHQVYLVLTLYSHHRWFALLVLGHYISKDVAEFPHRMSKLQEISFALLQISKRISMQKFAHENYSNVEYVNKKVNKYWHGLLTRHAKLRVAHAPGMPGTFFPPPRVSDRDMHHGTC